MINNFIAIIYRYLFTPTIFKSLQELRSFDIENKKDKTNHQLNKLRNILKSAIEGVPYYRNMNLSLDNDKFIYKEFQKIPILTKDIIRTKSNELFNDSYSKMEKVRKNTSGGSTGEPLEFYQTKDQGICGTVNYFYALHLNGINFYDKSVDLWGAERDMYNSNNQFNIKSLIHNKTTLNTFVLNDTIIADYIKILNKKKPLFIKAYVHSLYDIAKYINKNSIKINFKPTIHCTTGPLYPEMRKEISNAFNFAYVYNFYGSREVSAIATEVKGLQGMYVMFDNVFVEILDDNNNPVKRGEEGEIVITTLNNFYMPLLRYKIGDRAVKGDDMEWGALKMEKVIGRTLGVIYRNDGTKIDGQFFTTLFFNKKGIKSFQLIQKSISVLNLYIVKNKDYEESELESILKNINKELPHSQIHLIFTDKINLTRTGKIMYVYSEIEK
jgi:phenylacetate-CoA ligase